MHLLGYPGPPTPCGPVRGSSHGSLPPPGGGLEKGLEPPPSPNHHVFTALGRHPHPSCQTSRSGTLRPACPRPTPWRQLLWCGVWLTGRCAVQARCCQSGPVSIEVGDRLGTLGTLFVCFFLLHHRGAHGNPPPPPPRGRVGVCPSYALCPAPHSRGSICVCPSYAQRSPPPPASPRGRVSTCPCVLGWRGYPWGMSLWGSVGMGWGGGGCMGSHRHIPPGSAVSFAPVPRGWLARPPAGYLASFSAHRLDHVYLVSLPVEPVWQKWGGHSL